MRSINFDNLKQRPQSPTIGQAPVRREVDELRAPNPARPEAPGLPVSGAPAQPPTPPVQPPVK